MIDECYFSGEALLPITYYLLPITKPNLSDIINITGVLICLPRLRINTNIRFRVIVN